FRASERSRARPSAFALAPAAVATRRMLLSQTAAEAGAATIGRRVRAAKAARSHLFMGGGAYKGVRAMELVSSHGHAPARGPSAQTPGRAALRRDPVVRRRPCVRVQEGSAGLQRNDPPQGTKPPGAWWVGNRGTDAHSTARSIGVGSNRGGLQDLRQEP